MTFSVSVRHVFSNYATFSGRASRSEYWWWVLFTILVNFALSLLGAILFGQDGGRGLANLASLALLLSSLGVAVRRLHDADRSGWWILINLVPLIGFLIFIYFAVQPSDPTFNRFGPPPVA